MGRVNDRRIIADIGGTVFTAVVSYSGVDVQHNYSGCGEEIRLRANGIGRTPCTGPKYAARPDAHQPYVCKQAITLKEGCISMLNRLTNMRLQRLYIRKLAFISYEVRYMWWHFTRFEVSSRYTSGRKKDIPAHDWICRVSRHEFYHIYVAMRRARWPLSWPGLLP